MILIDFFSKRLVVKWPDTKFSTFFSLLTREQTVSLICTRGGASASHPVHRYPGLGPRTSRPMKADRMQTAP